MDCAYPEYSCKQKTILGSCYCLQHSAVDANAPYQQCQFQDENDAHDSVNPSNVKCSKLCLGSSGDSYCNEHQVKITQSRLDCGEDNINKDKVTVYFNQFSYLDDLKQYSDNDPSNDDGSWQSFVDSLRQPLDVLAKSVVVPIPNIVSDSDLVNKENLSIDVSSMNVDDVWWGESQHSDGEEGEDFESDDPLRHANYYTSEEIVRIMREKLIRLQKLYIDQFHDLYSELKTEYSLYMLRSEVEKQSPDYETVANFAATKLPSTESESPLIDSVQRLKALNHYCKAHGKDAILHSLLEEKRKNSSSSLTSKQQSNTISEDVQGGGPSDLSTSEDETSCIFSLSTHMKCGGRCLPMSKFCSKHILSDTSQVLFVECGAKFSEEDSPCSIPVVNYNAQNEAVSGSASLQDHHRYPVHCLYHTLITPLYRFSDIKKESVIVDSKPPETPPLIDSLKDETDFEIIGP